MPSNLMETVLPSAHPFSGRWHVSHDILPSLPRRLSKNSILPSSTFSGVIGLSGGTFISSIPVGTFNTVGAGGGAGASSFLAGSEPPQDVTSSSDANASIRASLIEFLRRLGQTSFIVPILVLQLEIN